MLPPGRPRSTLPPIPPPHVPPHKPWHVPQSYSGHGDPPHGTLAGYRAGCRCTGCNAPHPCPLCDGDLRITPNHLMNGCPPISNDAPPDAIN